MEPTNSTQSSTNEDDFTLPDLKGKNLKSSLRSKNKLYNKHNRVSFTGEEQVFPIVPENVIHALAEAAQQVNPETLACECLVMSIYRSVALDGNNNNNPTPEEDEPVETAVTPQIPSTALPTTNKESSEDNTRRSWASRKPVIRKDYKTLVKVHITVLVSH